MITRPLDLASRLRPRPRNFDAVFLVNGGLIALFFLLFGSRFVLSPGLREDLLLTEGHGSPSFERTTATVTVNASQQIFNDHGLVTMARLQEWLVEKGKESPRGTLLLIVDSRVPVDVTSKISDAATAAGFAAVQIAMQSAPAPEVSFPAP